MYRGRAPDEKPEMGLGKRKAVRGFKAISERDHETGAHMLLRCSKRQQEWITSDFATGSQMYQCHVP